jgi:hypothetical protein
MLLETLLGLNLFAIAQHLTFARSFLLSYWSMLY